MKTCIRCHQEKPLTSFGNHPTAKDGKRNQCESCRYQLRKARPTHAKQIISYRSLRYGITLEEFEKTKIKQNNKCAICKDDFEKTPHIDHDHKTKKVRGLLCHHCNTMLGLAKDSPQILERAIRYLSS